jgi:hypothetical protein
VRGWSCLLGGRAASLAFRPAVYIIVNKPAIVNIDVNAMSKRFREITDRLTAAVSLAELAAELGVSHGLIRQARLSEDATSYRNPPNGWDHAVAVLARRRARQLEELAAEIESRTGENR